MQLALYVHNHAPCEPRRAGGRVCGIAVGDNPTIVAWDPAREVTSFAEFRCDADVADPGTLLELAVAKAFAGAGAVAPGYHVQYRGHRCELRLGLEPGFDDPRAVLEPLLQLARGLAVREGRVVTAPDATASRASAIAG